jgi:hypothetical protein
LRSRHPLAWRAADGDQRRRSPTSSECRNRSIARPAEA